MAAPDMPDIEDALETLLRWRRDVRHFRPDPLDECEVERLLELAHLAPSVGFSQPWRFVRIRSQSIREQLAAHVDAEAARAGLCYEPDIRARYDALKLHGLREAPVLLAVFSDEETPAGQGLGAATMAETRAYSTVMAIHTLWLAARARGIGMGWVSILEPAFLSRALDTPGHWRLVALLCLGLPVEDSVEPELGRRGWQARIDWRDTISER